MTGKISTAKKKKRSSTLRIHFSLAFLFFCFFSHNIRKNYYKTTLIEYIDVTVPLESLNLTALLEYLI